MLLSVCVCASRQADSELLLTSVIIIVSVLSCLMGTFTHAKHNTCTMYLKLCVCSDGGLLCSGMGVVCQPDPAEEGRAGPPLGSATPELPLPVLSI